MPSLSPSQVETRRAAAEQELETRRRIRRSLADWAAEALAPADMAPAAHHMLLMERLQQLILGRGEARRLMVHMPPGAAKSTYGSVLFPAWALAARPKLAVVLACHTASLAEHLGRSVRHVVAECGTRLGYGLRSDERSAQRFATDKGGASLRPVCTGRLRGGAPIW